MSAASFLVRSNLSESTRNGYEDAVKNYEFFARSNGHPPPFPATVRSITAWLAHLVRSVKVDTANHYLTGVRNYHLENGLPPIDDPIIRKVIKGAKKVYDQGPKRERLPLTQDLIVKVSDEIRKNLYPFDNVNIHAALCLGFTAFLRAEEFTWEEWNPTVSPRRCLSRKHVWFDTVNGSVTLHLPSSKTD